MDLNELQKNGIGVFVKATILFKVDAVQFDKQVIVVSGIIRNQKGEYICGVNVPLDNCELMPKT